jgi:hypothetical protein
VASPPTYRCSTPSRRSGSRPDTGEVVRPASIKTPKWAAAAKALAERRPFFLKDGRPDWYALTQIAARCGFSDITEANLDTLIAALEHYADELDKAPAQGPLPSRASLEQFTSEAFTQATALGLEQCAGGVDFAVDTTTTTTTTVPVPGSPTDSVTGPTGVAGQPEGEETTQDQ